MARRKPRKTKKLVINAGTAWFLAILLISALASFITVEPVILFLVLGICGAMVAIYNIRFEEEVNFLIGIAALFIILTAWNLTGLFGIVNSTALVNFLVDLMVGLGVAGFIVSISLIFKIAIDK